MGISTPGNTLCPNFVREQFQKRFPVATTHFKEEQVSIFGAAYAKGIAEKTEGGYVGRDTGKFSAKKKWKSGVCKFIGFKTSRFGLTIPRGLRSEIARNSLDLEADNAVE